LGRGRVCGWLVTWLDGVGWDTERETAFRDVVHDYCVGPDSRFVTYVDRADDACPAVDGDIVAYGGILGAVSAYDAGVLKESEVAADTTPRANPARAAVDQEEAGANLGLRLDACAAEAAHQPAQDVAKA